MPTSETPWDGPVHDQKKPRSAHPALFSGSSDSRCNLLQPTSETHWGGPVHDQKKKKRSPCPVFSGSSDTGCSLLHPTSDTHWGGPVNNNSARPVFSGSSDTRCHLLQPTSGTCLAGSVLSCFLTRSAICCSLPWEGGGGWSVADSGGPVHDQKKTQLSPPCVLWVF